MSEFYKEDITIDEWLNFFSTKSNHWIFKYWRNNRENFFDRFMIMGDQELFIICDKKRGNVYGFKKPEIIQLNLESLFIGH